MKRTTFVRQLRARRCFHATSKVLFNPLLGPMDTVLEEVSEDLHSSSSKRLKKKKDPKILIPLGADSFKRSDNDPITLGDKNSDDSGIDHGNSNNNSNNNNNNNHDEGDYEYEEKSAWERFSEFLVKCAETSGITFASLFVLGAAGVGYHNFYKERVIDKMSQAFDKGDEAFELTMHKRTTNQEGDWIERPQQRLLTSILEGSVVGRYFLVTGEKGCGKSSMILNSMKNVDSFNCAFLDAHSDPEIFRIRLGKALRFEFHEDYIGSLFSIRGPRDTTALLDIERAFNKLEEVAVRRVKKYGKPLVLIINNAHLIKDDEEGVKLVELLQQKAEALSGAGLVTMIFNSDDYWLYERLKKLGTRLEVINVRDFNRSQAIHALRVARRRFFNEQVDDKIANQVYNLIGGRPQHLAEVSKQANMILASHKLIDREKTWFLNQCGLLGSSMDDDVNESGKFSTSAMLLMKIFVKMYEKDEFTMSGQDKEHHLPELPLWRARQIMTRNDYIQHYDNLNIFTIDSSNSFVRADSVPMMRGFVEIASQPGFEELLQDSLDRVAEIESLGRTREIVAKDLFLGGQYRIGTSSNEAEFVVKLKAAKGDDEEDTPIKMQPTTSSGARKFWDKRLNEDK